MHHGTVNSPRNQMSDGFRERRRKKQTNFEILHLAIGFTVV